MTKERKIYLSKRLYLVLFSMLGIGGYVVAAQTITENTSEHLLFLYKVIGTIIGFLLGGLVWFLKMLHQQQKENSEKLEKALVNIAEIKTDIKNTKEKSEQAVEMCNGMQTILSMKFPGEIITAPPIK